MHHQEAWDCSMAMPLCNVSVVGRPGPDFCMPKKPGSQISDFFSISTLSFNCNGMSQEEISVFDTVVHVGESHLYYRGRIGSVLAVYEKYFPVFKAIGT